MIRTGAACLAAAALAISATEAPLAQRPAASFPVIVVFHDKANLAGFAPGYQADERAAANPAAWGYLDRGVAGAVQDLERRRGFRAEHVYSAALRGFSARLSAAQIAELENDPNVAAVEPDGEMSAIAQTIPWGIERIGADQSSTLAGNEADAVNVNVYVIDTGIANHADLNKVGHVNFAGGKNDDCHGHGTHVAGTAAAKDNTSDVVGVAPGARLTGVKVLSCSGSGSTSGVIKGVDWVRANAVKPAVANMSLGGGASSALDTAVTNSIAAGITFAIAAGNSNANACNYSPARTANAITVGATTNTDNRSSFSNWGTCLDIFAPGSTITASWSTSDTATNTISGTSMASPHVAGAAALYLSANKTAAPQAVRDTLVNSATLNKVINPGTGSPNKLLFTGTGGQTPPPPPPPAPPPGSNVIINPGFENGTTGWIQTSSGGYPLISSSKPRTGSFSAWLTGYNSATETIGQTVTVASGSSTLRYWWHMTSSESTATPYDYLRVRIYNGVTGALIATPRTWSNTSVRNVWSQDTLGLAAYVGQSIRIVFEGVTDSSIISSFYIDDVSLGA